MNASPHPVFCVCILIFHFVSVVSIFGGRQFYRDLYFQFGEAESPRAVFVFVFYILYLYSGGQ